MLLSRFPDNFDTQLKRYLKTVLGLDINLSEWPDDKSLPLYLQERYRFFKCDLSGLPCILMWDRQDFRLTPHEITKHYNQLLSKWKGGVIYIAENLSATDRARLVGVKIPFIIAGKQLYLPPLGIDFRERFSTASKKEEALSPIGQVLILGHLYHKLWIRKNPTEIAVQLGYSKMSIGRAFSELQNLGLAEIRMEGKNKKLAFYKTGIDFWREAQPILRTPVGSQVEEVNAFENLDKYLSGPSALSQFSHLSTTYITTYAVWKKNKDANSDIYEDSFVAEREHIRLEYWTYNPAIFTSSKVVDRLSLYLSLRSEEDERVQIALDELLVGMKW